MKKPEYHELGLLECDRAFIPAVESGLRMLKVWQKSVSDPKNASLEEFGDAWCSGAAAILSIVFAGVGQHLVVTKERTTENFVVLELIEHRKPFIEPTAAGVLTALITELTRDVCREAKRVGLDVSHYGKWSKEEFKLLRVALGSLADIALRNDEIRKLKARVGREIMLVSGDPSDTEDGPFPRDGFKWAGQTVSGFSPKQFAFLETVWNGTNHSVDLDSLTEPVYGEGSELMTVPAAKAYAYKINTRISRDIHWSITVASAGMGKASFVRVK